MIRLALSAVLLLSLNAFAAAAEFYESDGDVRIIQVITPRIPPSVRS